MEKKGTPEEEAEKRIEEARRNRDPILRLKKAQHLQEQLDDLLIERRHSAFKFDDRAFPFRYASGGTLPIVRLEGQDYFCLFYRDIFPIGWNIANGGCLTKEELLNPVTTIERELVEELVVANRFKHTYGSFVDEHGRQIGTPRSFNSGSVWRAIFGNKAGEFEPVVIPAKRFKGPDTLKVNISGECNEVTNCFVNVNAEDFGIEIDQIIKIAPDIDAVFCDGEQTGAFLLNRLVGFFGVEKVEQQLATNDNQFAPDRLYIAGQLRDANKLSHIMRAEVIPHLKTFRNVNEVAAFESAVLCDQHLDLCPVTRRLIKRYEQRERTDPSHERSAVFISYGGPDEFSARKVYEELHHAVSTFFFREHSYRDVLARAIDDALDHATCLIIVGTSLENIDRDRCAYEWKRFCREWSANLKPSNAVILPFIAADVNPEDLPRELRDHYVVPFRPASFDRDLQELAKRIPVELRRAALHSEPGFGGP